MQAATIKQQVTPDAIKRAIAGKMDAACFSCWIAPLGIQIENNMVVLIAQNQFTADFIKLNHFDVINSVALSYGMELSIRVGATSVTCGTANDNNTQTYSGPVAAKKLSGFDSFIASDENAFVVSACKKVAMGTVTFSPLFIYGPAGCGKSLLADCINTSSMGRVVMMSGATFVSEFARALHDRTIFAFKDYCRKCDTFIIDDVNVLAGKRATCEEFIQLVMDLRAAGKNIVLTANAAPGNLTGFDHRAQSLFASGLVVDIVAPSRDARKQIFERAGLDSKMADMIAGRVIANGHVISGVLNKITAYRDIMGESVNMDVAEKILADTLKTSHSPIVMVKSMCEKLGVSYDAVCGSGRARALVLARQMMMVVLKNATGLSLVEIGQYVGGRDHATVMYGIDRIEKLSKSDLVMSAQIAEMIDEYK